LVQLDADAGFHDHRLGNGDRAVGRDRFRQAKFNRAPGGSVVFDPGQLRRTSASSFPDWVRRRMLRRSAEGATRVTLDEIEALGLRLAELCQKYGIAELSVFGSVARGDARPDSDIDLLYVRVPGNDLGMSYFALQDDLENLFGRPVDLVPKEGLHRVIRDQVLADAQVLYAA
jgi:uncharacterized protein